MDVVDERTDRLEEAPELGAPPKARDVSLLRIPLDANDVLRRILGAAGDLVALAVLRGLERLRGVSIRLLERVGSLVVDRVADVLDDHASTSCEESRPCLTA